MDRLSVSHPTRTNEQSPTVGIVLRKRTHFPKHLEIGVPFINQFGTKSFTMGRRKATRLSRASLHTLGIILLATQTAQSLTISSPTRNLNANIASSDETFWRDRRSRRELTITKSKSNDVQIDDFKDINIDDVLMEAENALKAAESSLVDPNGNGTEKGGVDLETFKEAVKESKLKSGQDNLKDALRNSLLSDEKGEKASIAITEILSSTMGGILFGTILGSFAAFKLSGLDSTLDLLSSDFSITAVEFVAPIVVGTALGGLTGFSGSMQDDVTGTLVRTILGAPVKAFASAIVTNIQDAARRQVEKTTNEIKAIPSNVANSAKQRAAQTAKEAKLAVEMAVEDAIEKAKKVLLGMALVSSVIAVVFIILNGGQLSTVTQIGLEQVNLLVAP